MLTIDRDKIQFIVSQAQILDADLPAAGDDPGSDLTHGEIEHFEEFGDATDAGDADASEADQELLEFINDLNEDEQLDLVALAWIGRGSFAEHEWAEARAEAKRAHNDRTAEYLLGMPLLPDYLQEGLNALDGQSAAA